MQRLKISGYENYSIDKFGNVYAHHLNRNISPYDNGLGYLAVKLRKDKKRKQFYVHRLVALTYLVNEGNLPDVNHRDGVKTNNFVDNLEWTTKSNNLKHAFINNLLSGFILKRVNKHKNKVN